MQTQHLIEFACEKAKETNKARGVGEIKATGTRPAETNVCDPLSGLGQHEKRSARERKTLQASHHPRETMT